MDIYMRSGSILRVTQLCYISCWQNYVDYYKCVNARGEDFEPCKQFYRAFHSLCPNEWVKYRSIDITPLFYHQSN